MYSRSNGGPSSEVGNMMRNSDVLRLSMTSLPTTSCMYMPRARSTPNLPIDQVCEGVFRFLDVARGLLQVRLYDPVAVMTGTMTNILQGKDKFIKRLSRSFTSPRFGF